MSSFVHSDRFLRKHVFGRKKTLRLSLEAMAAGLEIWGDATFLWIILHPGCVGSYWIKKSIEIMSINKQEFGHGWPFFVPLGPMGNRLHSQRQQPKGQKQPNLDCNLASLRKLHENDLVGYCRLISPCISISCLKNVWIGLDTILYMLIKLVLVGGFLQMLDCGCFSPEAEARECSTRC